MANKLTPSQIAAAVGVLAITAVGASAFFLVSSYQDLSASMAQSAQTQKAMIQSLQTMKAELVQLKSQQTELASPEHFRSAVISAIESYGQQQQQQLKAQKMAMYENAAEKLADGKHIYGSMTAQFTLVEFSDVECPYCKRFHPTAKDVVDKSNGLINWEWKHMPLSFHQPAAGVEAHAAECVGDIAGNRAFWVYLDEMFSHTKGNGQGTNELTRMATDLGVDAAAFKACMSSGKFQKRIDDDLAMGTSLGVTGTPTSFLIDNKTGKRLTLSGAQPASAVMSAVRSMMAAENEDSGAPDASKSVQADANKAAE